MRTFIDTSALLKRYVREAGTDRVLERCRDAEEIILAVLAVPEVLSACNRRRRERRLDQSQYDFLKRNLALDVAKATIIDLTPRVLQAAVECLERFPLRTLDALQLGAAMVSHAELFVSSDRAQCTAARGMNLQVDEIY
ncbi:MAG: type II toxin-antitoxin system VapC family toxin [Candidatus Xenobia bacterium]